MSGWGGAASGGMRRGHAMKAKRIVVAGMAALMGAALGGCVVEDGGGYRDFRGPPPRYDHGRRDEWNRYDHSDRRDGYGDRRDDGRYDNGGRDHGRSDRHGDGGSDQQGRDNNDHQDRNGPGGGGDHHDRNGGGSPDHREAKPDDNRPDEKKASPTGCFLFHQPGACEALREQQQQ